MDVPPLYCFDRDGEPILTYERLTELMGDEDYRRIAQDDLLTADGQIMWVSTVWIGMNHNFARTGAPIIFETMVFTPGMAGEYQERYTTASLAEAGHKAIVAQLIAGVPINDLGAALHGY